MYYKTIRLVNIHHNYDLLHYTICYIMLCYYMIVIVIYYTCTRYRVYTGCPGPAGEEQCGAVLFEMHSLYYQGMFIYMHVLIYTYGSTLYIYRFTCILYSIYMHPRHHIHVYISYPILPFLCRRCSASTPSSYQNPCPIRPY